ncbi:acyltransferase family protein [Bifidobacterium scaligerum]|nr:acyltransferase family protein [Bifidobacterium scaligerum]
MRSAGEMELSRKRVVWIDAAKGIAMILVFYGHLGEYWFPVLKTSFVVVYLFHMPLFFFLSGLFFHARYNFRELLTRRAYQLLVPYYVFSCLMLGKPIGHVLFPQIYAGKKSSVINGSAWQEILAIIFNTTNGLWFFWSLFWASIFVWIIIRILHDNKRLIVAVSILLLLCDVLVQHYITIALPFTMNRVLSSTAYVALGYVSREIVLGLRCTVARVVLLASVILFACVSVVFVSIAGANWLFVQLVGVVAAVCGITMIIAFARILPPPGWLQAIGVSTLVYYAFNDLMLKIFKLIAFKIFPSPMTQPWLIQITIAFAVLILSVASVYYLMPVVRKYLWWGIGMKKKVVTD